MKRKGMLLAIAVMMGMLVGCGEKSAVVREQTDNTVATGNEITIGVTSFADTLEPTEQYFSWVVSRYGIGETLVYFDEEGEFQPRLATQWEVSADKLTWTFTIRENVKFSNGTVMTPEMVKASLERTYKLSDRAETFFEIVSLEVQGQDLLITTTEPVANVPGSLADPLFLIVDTSVDTESFAMAGPICTGPYVVQSFDPTESCVVVKNEYYWDGEVSLDQVTLKCIDDQTTRSMALQTGEIDIAYNLKVENIADFEGDEDVQVMELDSLRNTFAFMNQNGVLNDQALRQAVIRGLDRETYCKILLEGGATAGKAPVPPTLDFGFAELHDENAYDVEGAKQILASAGYQDLDGDGFVETPAGETLDLNFVIYTSREELNVYAQAAQASLKDIGIKVTLQTVSYETLLDMRDASDFDLLIWNVLVANTGDAENYLRENWYSSSPSNQTGYSNKKVDELLDTLATQFGDEEREALTIEIQQLIMDDAATVFFGYETTYLFSNTQVTGVAMFPMDYYWLTKDVALAK